MNFSVVGGSVVTGFLEGLCLYLCLILLKERSRRESEREHQSREKAKSDGCGQKRRRRRLINNKEKTKINYERVLSTINPMARATVGRGTDGRQDGWS